MPDHRDVLSALPFVSLAPGLLLTSGAMAQTGVPGKFSTPKHCLEPALDTCKAFPYETLTVRYSDAGAPMRQIFEGRISASLNPAGNEYFILKIGAESICQT